MSTTFTLEEKQQVLEVILKNPGGITQHGITKSQISISTGIGLAKCKDILKALYDEEHLCAFAPGNYLHISLHGA